MDVILTRIVSLLCVAILVAVVARRLRLPYTVGIFIAGIAFAAGGLRPGLALSSDFIYDVILPPLLFEAAFTIDWKQLRRDMLPVLTLATIGVGISAVAVAAGMAVLLGWPIAPALVFGALIATTDPVAVIAMFKDAGLDGRFRLLVESESLFNDGVGAVLFALVLAWAQGAGTTMMDASTLARALALNVGGGILAGLACGVGAIAVAEQTTDCLVEAVLTVVAAYGSFLLAEHFHASGVVAVVAAGLLIGNLRLMRQSERGTLSSREHPFVLEFWNFAAFLSNSLLFLLVGLEAASVPFAALGVPALLLTIGLVLAGRALTVYPLCAAFRHSRWAIPIGEQHILWWGGLRGALGLALALSLPAGASYRGQIVIATFAVVIFSVVVQGITTPWLMRRPSLVARAVP